MVAHYIRLMLVLELAAYVAISAWLHFLWGWSYAALALGAAGAALAGRLAMVCVTTCAGLAAGAPRSPVHQIGIGGAAALILREWRALLATNFFCFPWETRALRSDPRPTSTSRVPILLVHGYFSNRGYFRALVGALEARGVEPVFAPNFRAAFATIEDFASQLDREIERIAAGTGREKLVLVCHSMGGLAARAYLCGHGADRVAKLITIASPHHGTVHALFAAGANARQMRRGSRFLAAICANEAQRAPQCGVTSIYSPHDNLVAPQETSRLAWAKNIAIPGFGHLDMLRSRRLFEVVLEELREAGVEARA
jgi:triacylglycerol esterase/lipase EstA (alpha/beta hydrolase family)